MVMGSTICRVTFGNGVRIGMTVIRPGVFCGAVLGTTFQAACVWLTATATIRRLPPAATVFVVCQDSLLLRADGRLTLVHA